MTFKPRPYDPDRPSKQTLAQQAATARNFRVFRLRALEANGGLLTGERRVKFTKLIDAELKAMGAQTTAEHAADFWLKHRRRRPKPKVIDPDDDVPF